ncbi:MAG: hypothetical protein ACRD2T_09670, partial [Thermoanaerobaculia bacterium]
MRIRGVLNRLSRARGAPPLNPEGTTFLSGGARRSRRPHQALKWLRGETGGSLRERLREDIAELASLRHDCFALPEALGVDPATGGPFLVRPFVDGLEITAALQARAPREILPFLVAAADALS